MLSPNDLQLLSDYLDDALTPAERTALEARLQSDAELRRELARLRATVELIGTLPTLSAPRSFALTPRMVRRPTIFTSAAFSAMSAAAAVILLVLGAALFTTRPAAPSASISQVAFASTQARTATAQLDTNLLAQTGSVAEPATATEARDLFSGGAAVPPVVGNVVEPTALKAATEPLADGLFVAAPTGTPAPTIAPMLYAAAPSAAQSEIATMVPNEGLAGDDTTVPSDAAGVAESQADAAAAQTAQDQQRMQSQEAAPASNSAAAQPPLPAPTLAPSEPPTETPTTIPSPLPMPTILPSAMPQPTLAPTAIPLPVEAPPSNDASQVVGVVLIIAALALLGLAVVTTLRRRR